MKAFLSWLFGGALKDQTFELPTHVFRYPNGTEAPVAEGIYVELTEMVILKPITDKHRQRGEFSNLKFPISGFLDSSNFQMLELSYFRNVGVSEFWSFRVLEF